MESSGTKLSITLVCLLLFIREYSFGQETTITVATMYKGQNMSLSEIPSDIPNNVGIILLSDNIITSVAAYAFSSFSVLETLNLSTNGIVNISDFAFCGTPLQYLYLDLNDLITIPNLSCVKPTLKELTLSDNQNLFHHFDQPSAWADFLAGFQTLQILTLGKMNLHVFPNVSNIASSLQELDVSDNLISSIPAEIFAGLASLRVLNLIMNELTSFPDFSFLPVENVLTEILVASNSITTLNSTLLENLPCVQKVTVARNRLGHLPDFSPVASTLQILYINANDIPVTKTDFYTILGQFKKLTSLTSFRFSTNELSGFPNIIGYTQQLANLAMKNNPLVCDCSMGWMKLPEAATYGIQLSDNPCAAPPELVNRVWSGISLQELCPGIKGFSVAADGINLALNKGTFQSSLETSGNSANAVDGVMGGHYLTDGCAWTHFEANPWWAVDLGEETAIKYLTVVNRQDCCSEWLHDYYIGVTNVSPSLQVPAPGNYVLCKFVEGVAPIIDGITCDVTVVGRYLVVQIVGTNESLSLCEVQVYSNESLQTTSTLVSSEAPLLEVTSAAPSMASPDTPIINAYSPGFAMDTSSTTCTVRTFTGSFWWMLDTFKPTAITGVHLKVSAQTTTLEILVLLAVNTTSIDTRDNYAECAKETIHDVNGVSLDQNIPCTTPRTSQKVWLTLRNLGPGSNTHVEICEFFILSH